MNSYNGFSPLQRERAQRWLVQQWNAGRIPRPKQCCACGQTQGIIHAHAEDYSEPFGLHIYRFPLCYRCHITLHCRFRNPAAWTRFVELLRAGWTWVPLFKPDFGAICSFIAGGEAPTIPGPPRPTLIFDRMFDHVIRPKPEPEPAELDLR